MKSFSYIEFILLVDVKAVWEGKVYIVSKKGGKWTEIYVRLPAEAKKELSHKQKVFVYKSPPRASQKQNRADKPNCNERAYVLFRELFILSFKDPELRKLIVKNEDRARIVKELISILRGEKK